MPFSRPGNSRSELSEHSAWGSPDLSCKPLSSRPLGHNHEAPREHSEPGCCCSSGTSDFRMVLTQHLQGVTMPAVRNAVEAERQWRQGVGCCTSAARFSRRALAMPSSGLRDLEHLRPRARRINCSLWAAPLSAPTQDSSRLVCVRSGDSGCFFEVFVETFSTQPVWKQPRGVGSSLAAFSFSSRSSPSRYLLGSRDSLALEGMRHRGPGRVAPRLTRRLRCGFASGVPRWRWLDASGIDTGPAVPP
jgi:hypothetical protein